MQVSRDQVSALLEKSGGYGDYKSDIIKYLDQIYFDMEEGDEDI